MSIPAHRKVVYHDFYDKAEQVNGVVLLNSPACDRWECEEYIRLLRTRRYSQEAQHSRCYFVCADGAYRRIRAYVDEKQAESQCFRLFSVFPLCDVVIGDMDSYGAVTASDDTEQHATMPADGFATVDDIPTDVFDVIHAKCNSSVAAFSSLTEESIARMGLPGSEELQLTRQAGPLRIFVRCQMTTDFHKAIRLLHLLRNRFPDVPASVLSPFLHSPSAISLLQTGGSILEGVGDIGSDIDDQRESDLCAEACRAEIVSLPTYLALGALGGRFDHEMGVISIILETVKIAHVVISNATNTIFACQPNGWTQFVRHPQHEGMMCGLVNYGQMKECETSGMLYNIVIGRGRMSETKDLVLGFGRLISVCNTVRHEVVTIDLRCLAALKESQSTERGITDLDDWSDDGNPPTLFTIERRNGAVIEAGR